ncbi:1,4-alpha-glucan branching enzyme [Novacetimonas pomaceti]|uniref:1,4-alpha-glucan branching enzyme n=1 Tax=Novacetimonas pomaceti TaxID=2021998 RepID=A0A318Q7M9_9PROT|nr:1,4-alpha-glucan branching enzyme [Novacetimonas pomaceti]PYD75557.1 1,4-alpha-glucan branching enzyme [Novacetimonas pomaceti]
MPRPDDKLLYSIPDGAGALFDGTCGDPFSILGRHNAGSVDIIRVFYRDARRVRLVVARRNGGWTERPMRRVDDGGLYIGHVSAGAAYRLKVTWADGVEETADPYSFPLLLSEHEMDLFLSGRPVRLDQVMGARPMRVEDVAGVRFAVWAPHARRVSVVGDFNIWDGRRHPMRLRHEAGIWEIFIPGIGAGERYKYEILDHNGRIGPHKSDPFALCAEIPPATASIIVAPSPFTWTDGEWMRDRGLRQADEAPIAIYEVHAPSWRRPTGDPALTMSWDDLARELLPHARDGGFSHIGLMPVMEHPSGWVWGCPPLGLFCPSARHGPPEGFARFVDACHAMQTGVILDWVPDRLPPDMHGNACFDGTALYEHPHPPATSLMEGRPLFYDLGRREVRGFLISSALMWLERYHLDGLRVDTQPVPAEQQEEMAVFLRELNEAIAERVPGAVVIASDTLSASGVTAPVTHGGMGFSFQWNTALPRMLAAYMERDPLWRGGDHAGIIARSDTAFSEKFILCHAHVEGMRDGRSLLSRLAGDAWQKQACMRTYLSFMWGWPGKKLLFMGLELAQQGVWNPEGQLDWEASRLPASVGMRRMVGDLNRLYRAYPALHRGDCVPDGFSWVIRDDTQNSVFAWLRHAADSAPVLVICNMTPVVRHDYRVGVPYRGYWREILNSDAVEYGGAGVGNAGGVHAHDHGAHGFEHSFVLSLPPLGMLYLSMAQADLS